ncbi:MAG: hypothetical protein LBH08_03245 [Puniceicoccales bacterium]|nr:hypothetical protein [Puniceicoccales bacterium]
MMISRSSNKSDSIEFTYNKGKGAKKFIKDQLTKQETKSPTETSQLQPTPFAAKQSEESKNALNRQKSSEEDPQQPS